MEVTCRTIQGRALLRPGPELNRRVLGVIGRAQRQECMPIHGLSVLSSHDHALLSPEEPDQLARFMHYVQTNVSKEAGDLHDWEGRFWARRYRHIPVSAEDHAQISRLRYIWENSVKESLVARPTDWPGVHSALATIEGRPMEGVWYDRSAFYEARRQGNRVDLEDYAERELVHLTPIPCWQGLSEDELRERLADLLESIEREHAERRRREGKSVLGVEAVRRRHPHDRPKKLKRSPAPRFHAATKEARLRLRDAYNEFALLFREAAELLKLGRPDPGFPEGSLPDPEGACPTFRTKLLASENRPRRSLCRASAFQGGSGTGEVRSLGSQDGPQHRQPQRISALNPSHDA